MDGMVREAPVKEDVGVFTADIVVRMREPEPCGQHDGHESRLGSSPISTVHDDWSLVSSFAGRGSVWICATLIAS